MPYFFWNTKKHTNEDFYHSRKHYVKINQETNGLGERSKNLELRASLSSNTGGCKNRFEQRGHGAPKNWRMYVFSSNNTRLPQKNSPSFHFCVDNDDTQGRFSWKLIRWVKWNPEYFEMLQHHNVITPQITEQCPLPEPPEGPKRTSQ